MSERKTLEIVAKLKDQISKSTNRIRESISRMSLGISRSFQSATRSVFNMRTALLGLAGGAVAREFVAAGASVQRFRVQLEALMQDEERAANVLRDIRRFAAESPLETENMVEAFVQLEAVGVKAAENAVKQLGNVALIFNRDIRDVASGFIGVETEVLRRLGVELKRAGDTAVLQSGKIRIETENTTVAIRDALLELWGKRFPNAMEQAGNMWDAQMAKFRGALFELRANMVENVLPALGKLLDRMSDFVNRNRTQWVAAFSTIAFAGRRAVEIIEEKFEKFFGDAGTGYDMATRFAGRFLEGLLKGALGIGFFVARVFAEIGVNIDQLVIIAVAAVKALIDFTAAGLTGFVTQVVGEFAKGVIDFLEAIPGLEKFLDTKALRKKIDAAILDSEELIARNREIWVRMTAEVGEALRVMKLRWQRAWESMFGELKNRAGAAFNDSGLKKFFDEVSAAHEQAVATIEEAGKKTREALGGGEAVPGGGIPAGDSLGRRTKKDPEGEPPFWEDLRDKLQAHLQKLADFKANATQIAEDISKSFSESFTKAFKDIAKGTKSLGDAMKSILATVLEKIADVLLNFAAMKAQALASRALLGIGGGLSGFFAANGAIMTGGWQPAASFAAGGIVRGPTLGVLGDNSSRVEAAVPMPDGKHIPVDLRGGGQSEINVNFTVVATDPRGIQQMLIGEKRTIIDLFREALATEPSLRNEVRGVRR